MYFMRRKVVRELPKKKTFSKEFAAEFGLIFREINDIGIQRTKTTPQPDVILNTIKKFVKKWENVKYSDSTNVLSKKVLSEIDNLKRHIKKGCLSAIDVGCGTNRDERLHREMNKILSSNRLGVELANARLNKLFMTENRKRDCTNSWPKISELDVDFAKDLWEKKSKCKHKKTKSGNEVFGIRPKSNVVKTSDTLTNLPPPTVISRKVKPIKSFTNEELFKLQVHIQEIERAWNKGENEGNTESNEDVLKPLLLEIIKQALA